MMNSRSNICVLIVKYVWTCLILHYSYKVIQAISRRRSPLDPFAVCNVNEHLLRSRSEDSVFFRELDRNATKDSNGYRSYVFCYCDPSDGKMSLIQSDEPERTPNGKVTVVKNSTWYTGYNIYAVGLSRCAIYNIVCTEDRLATRGQTDIERVRWKIIKILHHYGFWEAYRWNSAYARCAKESPLSFSGLFVEYMEAGLREFPF